MQSTFLKLTAPNISSGDRLLEGDEVLLDSLKSFKVSLKKDSNLRMLIASDYEELPIWITPIRIAAIRTEEFLMQNF